MQNFLIRLCGALLLRT